MTVVYNGYSQDELDLQYNMGFQSAMPTVGGFKNGDARLNVECEPN